MSASYELTKMHQLSKKGTYEFQAVYKCYNDGTLVETISSSYIVDVYIPLPNYSLELNIVTPKQMIKEVTGYSLGADVI